jgi:hypothetical protein
VAVVAAFYAVMVPLRIHQHGVLSFVHLAAPFVESAHTSSAIDSVPRPDATAGYDGQFYYFIALDPAHARDYMHVGTDDQSGLRYARIVYPLLARAVAAGSIGGVPWALLAISIAAVLVGTGALAYWLAARGRSPAFAVLYGLWPGMVVCVFRDLAEPLAYCLAILALVVWDVRRTSRVVAAGALLATALLTRETTIPFVVAGVVALALHDRRAARPVVFGLAVLAPVVIWRVILTEWLGVGTLEGIDGKKGVLPFYGLRAWWPFEDMHWLMFLTLTLPLTAAGLGGVWLLWRRHAIPAAALLVTSVALFVVFLPKHVQIDYAAAGRNALPAVIGALVCVPAVRSRLVLTAGSFFLSPVWFLLAAELLGLRGLDLVTS